MGGNGRAGRKYDTGQSLNGHHQKQRWNSPASPTPTALFCLGKYELHPATSCVYGSRFSLESKKYSKKDQILLLFMLKKNLEKGIQTAVEVFRVMHR